MQTKNSASMNEWIDQTVEWYAQKFGDYATKRLATDRLQLQPDSSVLDIGCGTGSALWHAALRVTESLIINCAVSCVHRHDVTEY